VLIDIRPRTDERPTAPVRSKPASAEVSRDATGPAAPAAPPVSPGTSVTPHSLAIDWASEARIASSRAVDAADAAARRARQIGGTPADAEVIRRKQVPKSDFGWNEASTKRVEGLEGGGMVLRLSERCAIVFLPVPLPGCALGEIKARGDLFEHLDDPPRLGERKDE